MERTIGSSSSKPLTTALQPHPPADQTVHYSSPHSPGSRIWKIGFSGEARPRKVFYAGDSFHDTLSSSSSLDSGEGGIGTGTVWDIDLGRMAEDLDKWRVRCGWGDEADEEADGRIQVEAGVKVEGETRERKEEVLRLIRARVVRIFRDVYYK